MKAAVLEKINSPLMVREVELTELKIGQVLVKVLLSGICGSQIHEICGYKGNSKFLPHLMGHEGCGIVQDIGPGVTKVRIGDKVVMHWKPGKGIESEFPAYILDGKIITSGKVTTFNQYSIVSENRLTAVPSDSPETLCAFLGCSLTTAFGIINHETNLKFGESVAIIGCGGVGLNLIQGAVMRNALPVIAIDNNEKKREMSLNQGANIFINSSTDNVEKVLKTNCLDGVDVMIDTTGNSSALKNFTRFLSNNGRLILVGQPPPGVSLEIPNALNLFNGMGQSIKATQGGQTDPDHDIPRYLKLYKAGKYKIESIATHVFFLEQINEAFDLLRTGNAGRILIIPNET